MKKIAASIILLSLLFGYGSFKKPQSSVTGAWHEQKDDDEAVMICTHDYMVVAEFNQILPLLMAPAAVFQKKRPGN
jgi:hypothetical protein